MFVALKESVMGSPPRHQMALQSLSREREVLIQTLQELDSPANSPIGSATKELVAKMR